MVPTEIQTQRLRLVLHTLEDIHALIESASPEERAQMSPIWLARVQAATSPDPWTHGFALVLRESNAVIGKCGFRCVGDILDPEDGVVWRWEKLRVVIEQT